MLIVPVRLDVSNEPENVVAVIMPADIVIAVPTLSSVKVETPEEALIFDVIILGNLSSLIVPVVIFAPSERFVAIVAVPVTSPVTLPVRFPIKVDAVIIPVTFTSPKTSNSLSDAPGLVVVLIPIFEVV